MTQFLGFPLKRGTHQFHNNFVLGHQLVCQTQPIHDLKHKNKITFQKTTQNNPKIDPLGILTHVHSNPQA